MTIIKMNENANLDTYLVWLHVTVVKHDAICNLITYSYY